MGIREADLLKQVRKKVDALRLSGASDDVRAAWETAQAAVEQAVALEDAADEEVTR